MTKRVTKKRLSRKNFFLTFLIICLIVLNIYTFYKYQTKKSAECTPCLTDIKLDSEYNKDNKYYKEIKFSEFKKLYNGKSIATIAVTDNSSQTHDMFVEYINKKAYYERTNINLIELSKLSKKNEVAFYNLNDRFSKLESDYIILVSDGKIISVIEFSKSDLNSLVELYK